MALTSTPCRLPVDLYFDLDEALTADEAGSLPSSATESLALLLPAVSTTTGVCAVCMEEFGPGDGGRVTPCCHVYHDKCIAAWLVLDTSCPLCRRQISPFK